MYLIQKRMKIFSEASLVSQSMFVIHFLFDIDENPFWSIHPLSEHPSFFKSHKKIKFSGASLPNQSMFLIQFFFKTDENHLRSSLD